MNKRRHTRHIAAMSVVAMMLGGGAIAEPVDDNVHLGVASCATGVCHGKLTEQEDSNVWLNEYRIWSADDRHARSYQTLLTDESKTIARKLGLPNAQGAKICLDCHADNVAQEQRGKKFQLSDGVGCEACHGGAENWIESHTEPGISHKDNLAAGMLGTEDINTRAEVCLSCHLGTSDQFATHRIMGAGHPRLAFELEAYTYNQPAHYGVDEDYLERKGAPSGFAIWRAGQLETTRRYLDLLQSDLFAAETALPDFAFYDCHSCHHSMDDIRWPDFRRQQGLEPGGLRLQDQHLFMLRAVTGILAPDQAGTLRQLHVDYLQAGQRSVRAAKSAAGKLESWLAGQDWLTSDTSDTKVRGVRKAIAALGASGVLTDYSAAEQAALALQSLSYYLDDYDSIGDQVNALFDALSSDKKFSPARFQQAAKRLTALL
jgi:hypothetical protein